MADSPCDSPNRSKPCGGTCCGISVQTEFRSIAATFTKKGYSAMQERDENGGLVDPPGCIVYSNAKTTSNHTTSGSKTDEDGLVRSADYGMSASQTKRKNPKTGEETIDPTTGNAHATDDVDNSDVEGSDAEYKKTHDHSECTAAVDEGTGAYSVSGSSEYEYTRWDDTIESDSSSGECTLNIQASGPVITLTEGTTMRDFATRTINGENWLGFATVETDTVELSGEVNLPGLVSQLLAACSFEGLEWGQAQTADRFDPETESPIAELQGNPNRALRHGSNDTCTMDLQHAQYRFAIGFYKPRCSGDGSYQIRWRERFTPDDDDAPITYVARSTVITPPIGDDPITVYSDVFTLNAPGEEGVVEVVGLEVHAIPVLLLQSKGYSYRKQGFAEYTQTPGVTPRFFKKETASGSFPGIPSLDLPARTYSGYQILKEGRHFDHQVTTEDCSYGPEDHILPASVYEDHFSDDARGLSRGAWPTGLPVGEAPPNNNKENGYPTPTALTATSREWKTPYVVDGVTIYDQVRYDLSDEFTTAELVSTVDQAFNGPFSWCNDGLYSDDDEANCCYSTFGYAYVARFNSKTTYDVGAVAMNILSADETFCAKQKVRFKLRGILPRAFSEEKTFTYVLSRITTNLLTGESTRQNISYPLNFDVGETVKTMDAWTEIGVPSNMTMIELFIDPELQPSHPDFCDPNIWCRSQNNPKMIGD